MAGSLYRPRGIVIHCSDSRGGDVGIVGNWHRKRGFSGFGYHFLITNGRSLDSSLSFLPELHEDGRINAGRYVGDSVMEEGAHARGYNTTHIGICLVGQDGVFTERQLGSLRFLCKKLMSHFGLKVSGVIGHYEVNSNKTCPDLDMDEFRRELS